MADPVSRQKKRQSNPGTHEKPNRAKRALHQFTIIAKRGLLLSRGREHFSDFESSVLRLKSTHVADCKPQAPPGRRWDFALELGYGRFLKIKLGPVHVLSS